MDDKFEIVNYSYILDSKIVDCGNMKKKDLMICKDCYDWAGEDDMGVQICCREIEYYM